MGDTHPDPGRPADAPPDAPAAARLARAARAAEELCATLWEAMHEELRMHEEPHRPRAQRVGELAGRLAQICSAVAALVPEGQASGLESPEPAPGSQRSELPRKLDSPPEPPPGSFESPEPPREPEIAIHDTRQEGPQALAAPRGGDLRMWAWPGGERLEIESLPPPSLALPHDVGGEGQLAWAQAIEAGLERHAADGLPFAALLIEVPDVERLAQAESPAELASLFEALERAVGPELRPSDTLVRESRGRWWLTASRTNAPGARTLAERLARIVGTVASHRGVPLDLAVGIAVCPADGRDVATLAAHADVGLYAARAAGRPVAPVDDAA
jgi:GGDEF domain-containing protein